jgi:hypothetical protein
MASGDPRFRLLDSAGSVKSTERQMLAVLTGLFAEAGG